MDYISAVSFANAWFTEYPLALGALLAWSFVWKGLALWRAGRSDQPIWFIAILLINTAGILEIIYLLFFAKKRRESATL